MFSTEEILEIARTTEAETIARKKKKQPQRNTNDSIDLEEEIEIFENNSTASESECIVVAQCS